MVNDQMVNEKNVLRGVFLSLSPFYSVYARTSMCALSPSGFRYSAIPVFRFLLNGLRYSRR